MMSSSIGKITQVVPRIGRGELLAAWGGGVIALLLAGLLTGIAERTALLGWLGAAVLAYGIWILLLWQRRGIVATPPLVLGGSLVAVVWGSVSYVVTPITPTQQPMLLLLPALVAAGVFLSHATQRWSGNGFVFLVLAPLALRCALSGDLVLMTAVAAYMVGLLLMREHVLGVVATGLQADLRLADSEQYAQRCQTILNQTYRAAELGDWDWDVVRNQIHCSEQARALLGQLPDVSITPQSWLSTIHWDDRASFQYGMEEAIRRGGNFELEFRVVDAAGQVRVLRDVGEVLHDSAGRAERIVGVVHDITGRVMAEKKTREALDEVNRILNHMQDTYYRADPVGRLATVSNSMESLLGYQPDECVGMRIADLYAVPGYGKTFLDDLHVRGGVLRNYEIHMRNKREERIWVSVNAQFINDERGRVIGIEGTIRDINELKQAQQALQQEKERALVTLQSIGDGVITTDEFGVINYLNPTAERLLHTTTALASGKHHSEVLRLVDEATGDSLGDLVRMSLAMDAGAVHAEEGMLIQDEGRFHLKITAAPMRDQYGHVVGVVLALHDITEVMGMARQLSYQATHDLLTGLYNRNVFERRVEEKIREAQGGGGISVVFYMDLDQFKIINDTSGHQAGDELLKQIASLMQQHVREADVLSRLGGDEFGVLLEHCPLDKAQLIADAIRVAVRDYRFTWQEKSFEIGISIGVVAIGPATKNVAEVMAAADAACYVAKDRGRNRVHVYQPNDLAVAQRYGEMEWVYRLSSAFENQRFVLYAQPVVHIAGDQVVSHYEILLRMLDEGGRVVSPGTFIPAAERYNLMPTIDRWVIRETFTQLHEAQGELAFPPVECAINLSGQSLCDEHFLEYVIDLFKRTGIPCESICFEITETAAIANLTRATRFMAVLRGMGCSFALDDFGSGLSSFSYLKTLPVDYLKIDGAFVRDMVIDKVDRAMVESINQMGHLLNIKTIAEFAESPAVLLVLQRIGVDYAQGSAVAMPSPLKQVLEKESRQIRNGGAVH